MLTAGSAFCTISDKCSGDRMDYALTKKELATISGYTYRRLFDIDQGLPQDKKLFIKSENGKYDLALFVQRWVAYNMDRESGSDMSLEDAKAVHEQVKIEKTQLEVARMRGELVDINDVRRIWGNVANTVVQNLIRIPGKIGQQVYMLDDQDMVIQIIDREIRSVLETIADTPLPDDAAQNQEDAEDDDEEE